MNGFSHGAMSWLLAQVGGAEARDRRIIAWAGLSPDFDVLPGILYGLVTADADGAWEIHATIHHRYTHGFAMAFLVGVIGLALGTRRVRTACFAFGVVMLHVLCDVIGSGPGWPVFPYWPINNVRWAVDWSFPLQSWPNWTISAVLAIACFLYIGYRERSPFEMLGDRLEDWFVRELRQYKQKGAAPECECIPPEQRIDHD